MDSGIVLRLMLSVAEVTFVEYGNSAACALCDLQPWDALIGEDGQLMSDEV